MEPSADIYTDLIHHLQKIEQSAARLAQDAHHMKGEQLSTRIEQHERAVVFAVIQMTDAIQRLAQENGR